MKKKNGRKSKENRWWVDITLKLPHISWAAIRAEQHFFNFDKQPILKKLYKYLIIYGYIIKIIWFLLQLSQSHIIYDWLIIQNTLN